MADTQGMCQKGKQWKFLKTMLICRQSRHMQWAVSKGAFHIHTQWCSLKGAEKEEGSESVPITKTAAEDNQELLCKLFPSAIYRMPALGAVILAVHFPFTCLAHICPISLVVLLPATHSLKGQAWSCKGKERNGSKQKEQVKTEYWEMKAKVMWRKITRDKWGEAQQ